MHVLELFSGTGSVGRPFRDNGWEVTSVDLDYRYNPEINTDIMTWDYTKIKTPDVIWSSPPCTCYSQARTISRVADFTEADATFANKPAIPKGVGLVANLIPPIIDPTINAPVSVATTDNKIHAKNSTSKVMRNQIIQKQEKTTMRFPKASLATK